MKEKKTQFIDKDMKIGEVVAKYPETIEVFFKEGLHCVGCGSAFFETIEEGCQMHGINVKKLLKEVNKVIEKREKD